MTDAGVLAIAVAAARAWGDCPPPRLISNRENAVFEVVLPTGRAALRLHRAGYQTEAAIRSELWWLEALAGQGLRVPVPLLTRAGDLLCRLGGGRVVSVVGWIEGVPLGAAGVPLPGDAETHRLWHRALGRTIAALHNATDRLSLPADFERPPWDSDGLLGESPLWGRFWQHPGLGTAEVALLQAARRFAHDQLLALAEADFGLIHADILRENVLLSPAGLTLIDFDDSGFGFRLYDLGTVLSQNLSEPHLPVIARALTEGYGELRPLAAPDLALLPVFTLLRTLASVGWTMQRLPPEHSSNRPYIDRALRTAGLVISGNSLLGLP